MHCHCWFAESLFAAADFDSKTIGKYPKWSEKKAQWREQAQSIKTVDFVGKTEKIVVSAGKSGAEFRDEREGFYNAHPTALKLDDGGILCVWNVGHGGNAGPVARSDDGGKTWTRIDKIMPDCYRVMRNCPSIYSVRDLNGKRFIQILSGKTRHLKGKFAPSEEFYKGYMPRVYSEDNGKTWRKLPPLSPSNPDELFACLMAFTSMVELKDGSTMAFFHKGDAKNADRELRVFTSITKDGGFTWSNPVKLVAPEDIGGLWACEPYAFRSPDGSEICCIMQRKHAPKRQQFGVVQPRRGQNLEQANRHSVGAFGRQASWRCFARRPPFHSLPRQSSVRPKGLAARRVDRLLRRH